MTFLLTEIRKALAAYLNIEEGTIHLSTFHQTHNSSIYLATLKNGSEDCILIKQVVSEDFNFQYDSHLNVYNKLQGSTCHVPKPLGLLQEYRMILMKFVDGGSLYSELLGGHSDFTASELVRKASRWLACYHEKFSSQARPYEVHEKYDDIVDLIREKDIKHRLPPLFAEAMNQLHKDMQFVSSPPVQWGGFHGDFKPENVLVEKTTGEIYGIDYILDRSNCQLMDLAQFANHLLFMCVHKQGFRIFFRRNRLIDEFMSEYSKIRGPVSMELINWFRIEHLLRHLALELASPRLVSKIQSWFLQYEIRHLLKLCRR
jgi:serine/threonine protein kinase